MQILAKNVVDVQITNNLVKGTGGTHSLYARSFSTNLFSGKIFLHDGRQSIETCQKFNNILQTTTKVSEPVVQRCSVKKEFLKVSQISQEMQESLFL